MSCLTLVTLGSIFYGVSEASFLNREVKKIVQESFPALEWASGMTAMIHNSRNALLMVSDDKAKRTLEQFEQEHQRFQKRWAGLHREPEVKPLWQSYLRYVTYHAEAIDALQTAERREQQSAILKQAFDDSEQLFEDVQNVLQIRKREFIHHQNSILSITHRFSDLFAALSFVLICVVGWVVVMNRELLDGIRTTVSRAQRLGDGHFKDPICIDRDDELGVLLKTFESLRTRVRQHIEMMDQEVMDRSNELAVSIKEKEELLNSIDLGVFTIDKKLRVDGETSVATEALLGFKMKKRLPLLDVLSLEGELRHEMESWLNLLFQHDHSHHLWLSFSKLNPLQQWETPTTGKTLSLEVRPVIRKKKLSGVMFLLRDMTMVKKSEQAINRSQRKKKSLIEWMSAVIQHSSLDIDEVHQQIKSILDQGFSNLDLEKLYCQIHTIKGCCGALGLDVLVEQWATLERHLHQCRKSNQCHLDGPWQNQWQEIRDDYIEWENLKSQIKIQPEHEIQVDRQRFQALCDDMMSQSQLGDAVSVWVKRLIACQSHAFRKSCQKLKQRIDHLSQALNKGNVQLEILGSEELVHPECERLLSKIMPHLVNNAIDHAFPEVDETVDFKPRITIELESKGTFCRLKFKDNGRGLQMPDSTAGISPDQIFQSGVSSKSDVSDVSGHGVGLTAVQSMLKDCGGEIDVISRSSGTEFNIQIPLNQVGAPLKISDG